MTMCDVLNLIFSNFIYDLTFVGKELTNKLEEFKRQIMVDRNQNLHWWPKVDWDQYVFKEPDPHGKKCKGTCECGHEFWIVWHWPWHPNQSWGKVQDKNFKKFIKTKKVKRWPSWKAIIQKYSGWNHMTCHICNHQFCWHWGDTYTVGHFNTFATCSLEGDNRIEILIMMLILPLILFCIPFTIVFAFRKMIEDCWDWPWYTNITWVVAVGVSLVLGCMMQAFYPLAICFLFTTWMSFQMKKCRYRY